MTWATGQSVRKPYSSKQETGDSGGKTAIEKITVAEFPVCFKEQSI